MTPTAAVPLPPPPEPSVPALLSLPDLAARTGTSASWWRARIRRRELRSFRLGDLVRVSAADAADFLAARAVPPRPRGGPAQPAGGAE